MRKIIFWSGIAAADAHWHYGDGLTTIVGLRLRLPRKLKAPGLTRFKLCSTQRIRSLMLLPDSNPWARASRDMRAECQRSRGRAPRGADLPPLYWARRPLAGTGCGLVHLPQAVQVNCYDFLPDLEYFGQRCSSFDVAGWPAPRPHRQRSIIALAETLFERKAANPDKARKDAASRS